MELYIGGVGQGKLEYVMEKYKKERLNIVNPDRMEDELEYETGSKIVFNDFHLWIRKWMQEETTPNVAAKNLFLKYPDCIVISDEIGNGLVPMEAFEREYREQTGRILIEAARQAERVERIICGLAQRLK